MKKCIVLFVLTLLLITNFKFQPVHANEERKMQDETIYMIMVDRFNNGDVRNDNEANPNDPLAYHGGDFKGVIDKLDYLKEMGFTAIWLTPIFENTEKGYHGYWINDFYKTNDHFGTMEEFKTLVKEAHDRDMKVILDFVVNHVGPNHEWLSDSSKQDWFHEKKPISNWDDPNEVENGWLYDLPDLNQDNPEVRKYLIDAAKWWINETDIDGYRLDTVKHVPKDFWTEFSAAVKSEKDSFFLIGEVWHDNPNVIIGYQDTGIDGFLDFSQNDSLRTAFEKTDQSLGWLFSNNDRNQKTFDRPEKLGQFLDTHDIPRFAHLAINNNQDPVTQVKQGLTFLYTAPGIPIVYYGTENAMDGGNDPDNRGMMEFNSNDDLINYLSKLGKLRQDLSSLTRGNMELLYEEEGMAVFKRTYQAETVVVAINNTSESQKVVLTEGLEKGKELIGLLNGGNFKSDRKQYSIELKSGQSEIYELRNRGGITWIYIAGSIVILFAVSLYVWIKKRKKQNVN
ncbi:alpha-amlyase [Bacillus sp. FJAT-22090]|uniref:alpha-amylase family glycosyl hydrolase n=1 Tax=Bacillus sp. FJAT-22090 TaxID=1581038 RepID=UPI0006AEB314|nr:alpha-amylase family glycosyl hydrolase [Bacillus sp. FJAT-22090]ALC85618.1 alpha-amlyase [Bacillus sp. FJAT-22090]